MQKSEGAHFTTNERIAKTMAPVARMREIENGAFFIRRLRR
ncbi:MAG TPA: hypothetical protein VMF66_20005 [Candidatus Acidoferrum sp.]|nr:hypothetical protein [Candidatus Acidoferrum sp.]